MHVPRRADPFVCHVCFFNDTATTEIYTLSLHDALPIFCAWCRCRSAALLGCPRISATSAGPTSRSGVVIQPRYLLKAAAVRSEEHTSELQSRQYLVCRLLLENKNRSLM